MRAKKPSPLCRICGQTITSLHASRRLFCSVACRAVAQRTTEADFWSRVARSGDPDACWLWQEALNEDGYGVFKHHKHRWPAHRLAWTFTQGEITPGFVVCHRCDARYPVGDVTYRRCCNPAHLWLGTQGDNVRDMFAKGRNRSVPHDEHWTRTHPERVPRGADRPRAVLAEEQVRTIRARYAAGGISQPQLAALYGVTHPTIGYIVRGKTWRHLL